MERLRWLVDHPCGQEVIPVMMGLRRKKSWGPEVSSELREREGGEKDMRLMGAQSEEQQDGEHFKGGSGFIPVG